MKTEPGAMHYLDRHRAPAAPALRIGISSDGTRRILLNLLKDGRDLRKRCFDIPVALALLIMAAPALALIALLVKIDSHGPVFFRQPRFGLGRMAVVVTKFRTMRVDASDVGGQRQARIGDDRVTRIGRFLRATCLDELPQLYDVLCGRMSLVGPRPHPLELGIDGVRIEELIPYYHVRHTIRPGMTGLAQIRGNRGPIRDVQMCIERLLYDIEYAQRISVQFDLYILLKTLAVPFQTGRSY